ncbi:MAG: hypothetical protein PHH28_11420 [Desulfuromonadaceae bacterium]|nr:hypothetical protein [Desulfuromonadaceae bacterium]
MICTYKDGLKVSYSGSLQITKGKDVNVLIKEGYIPANVRSSLDLATSSHSCRDMRKVAKEVTATFGTRACIH